MFDLALAGNLRHKDINLVYPEKHYMGELVKYFCEVNNVNREVTVNKQGTNHYTGAWNRWQEYEYPRIGLKEALKKYN
jgi:hypothetical protein